LNIYCTKLQATNRNYHAHRMLSKQVFFCTSAVVKLLVLIDSKQSDTMKLRQFRNENSQ